MNGDPRHGQGTIVPTATPIDGRASTKCGDLLCLRLQEHHVMPLYQHIM
jgi:hypothetical protein